MHLHTAPSAPTTTPVLLLAVIIAILALMALPRRSRTPGETHSLRSQHTLALSVETLRGAVERYRREHGEWPGLPPHSGLERRRYSTWFVRQLCMASDGQGEVVEQADSSHPFGPYLETAEWVNPVNRRSDVYLLKNDECMPSGADGHSAWIFDPCNGELHMNAVGCVEGTNQRYFDI